MNFAYRYNAHNQSSKAVTGLVYAETSDSAYAKLKRAGLRVASLRFDILGTLNGLSGKFDIRELVRFYRTMGKRLEAGKPMISGMEAAISFTTDPLLINALRLMQQRLMDGAKVADAMHSAGFPERDLNVIRAADASGKQGQAFIRLSEDVERTERLRSAISSTFLPMKVLAIVGLIGVYVAMGWLSPTMIRFFAQWSNGNAPHLPPAIVLYNAVAVWVAAHKIAGAAMLMLLVFAGNALLNSRLVKQSADYWNNWRMISEKSDHSSAWTSFGLLYDAGGISAYESAAVVRKSCVRQDSQDMFNRMDKILRLGVPISVAVTRAGFPLYVINGVKSAEEGGASLAEGLLSMVSDLEQDVEVMTGILKIKITYLSQIFGGLIVSGFFYVTLYPMYIQIGQKL